MNNLEFAVSSLQPNFSIYLRFHKDKTPMIRAAMYTTMLQGSTIHAPAEDLLFEEGPLALEPPLLVAVPLVVFVAFCSTAS